VADREETAQAFLNQSALSLLPRDKK